MVIKQCEYFCILAGGGVRGTAYLGVFKMLEELGIKITGLAGSSVGSVFASLYAVGYTYEEIKELIFNTSFQIFRDIYIPSGKDFGLCKGENLYYKIKSAIEHKFYGENFNPKGNKPVTFKDINKNLIIIATNISNTSFKEFSKTATPDVEIAYSVRTSISIPGFFKPIWENDDCLIDGDVINNFPVWMFSGNSIFNIDSRIIEFRLEGERGSRKINNLFDYFNAILDTSYNISTDLLYNSYSQNDQFDIIKINTGKTQVIDFNISNEIKGQLIESGYNCTKKYFETELVQKRENILNIYLKLEEYLSQFKNETAKDKTKDSLVTLGNLFLFLAENKMIIHKKIYNRIIEFKKLYLENLAATKFFNIQYLKNKNNIMSRLERIIKLIKSQILELDDYLSNSNFL